MTQIGFIGADKWAAALCKAIKKTKDVSLAGIYSADDSAEKLAAEYGAPSAGDIETLVADSGVLCVDVATDEKIAFIKEALEQGKKVYSVFPPAASGEGLDDLKSLSGQNVKFGNDLRSRTEYKKLKDAVANGDLGNVGMVRIGVCLPKPEGWRADEKLSGGALVETGAAVFDYLNYAFGGVARVYGLDAKSSDNGSYHLLVAKLKSGPIAHIEISHTELGVAGYTYYEVAGSNGILDYDSRREPVFQLDTPESSAHIQVGDHWSDVEVKAIATGEDGALASVEDAIAALDVALKVKEGVAAGKVVTFS